MSHLYLRNEVFEGFKISLSLQDDPVPSDWDVAPPGEMPQLAFVGASRHGVELAETCLGGCYYEKPSDFLHSGYYEDMRKEVVEAAKAKIKMLQVLEET